MSAVTLQAAAALIDGETALLIVTEDNGELPIQQVAFNPVDNTLTITVNTER